MQVLETLPAGDPRAVAITAAIQGGDIAALRALLAAHPDLANTPIANKTGLARTPVLIATDWPGHFPRVATTIAILAAAGADVNVRLPPHPQDPNCRETPLHQAASSNDVAAIDALLDAGADINATGAIFTGGGPLSDAVIFANWDAAGRLVSRGAQVEWWQAAALGLLDTMRTRWDMSPPPTREEITRSLWHACRGAQRSTAEFLLDQGGDPHWVGWDGLTPVAAAEKSGNTGFVAWLRSRL
jgi:ankyrin repeat protein